MIIPEKPHSRLQKYQLDSLYQKKIRPELRPELKPESRPESIEKKISRLLENGPLSKGEIAKHLGHKQISGRLKKVLTEMIRKETINFTIPEKPNSRLQKYKLNC